MRISKAKRKEIKKIMQDVREWTEKAKFNKAIADIDSQISMKEHYRCLINVHMTYERVIEEILETLNIELEN